MLALTDYCRYNESLKPSLVFRLGADAGFFSEINNMLLAQLYCLDQGIRFRLYARGAQFSPEGWTGFFEPFCTESSCTFHRHYNVRDIGRSRVWALYSRIRPLLGWPLLTQDVWIQLREPERLRYSLPFPGWEDISLRDALRELFRMIWRYNTATSEAVHALIQSLSMPEHYLGMHIRAGDKNTEHPLMEASVYIEKAEKVSSLRHAFVLTDDYDVFSHLSQHYPDWTFYTLCQPSEKGYFHRSLGAQGAEKVRDSHLRLLASSDILERSEHFIGTFSSNPGMNMGIRMQPGQCHGVDFENWRIW